jgi:hypothetical protein
VPLRVPGLTLLACCALRRAKPRRCPAPCSRRDTSSAILLMSTPLDRVASSSKGNSLALLLFPDGVQGSPVHP